MDWMGPLVDPERVVTHDDHAVQEPDGRPAKRIKEEPDESNVPTTPAPPVSLLALAQAEAQRVVTLPPPPPSNATNPSASSMNYLPLFNQICTQRRLQVDWQAEFQGPPHAGRWNVRCFGE